MSSLFDRRLAVAALGVIAVIIYGSLFPFHFRWMPLPLGPLRELLSAKHGFADSADNTSNVMLYLPLGLVWVRMLRRGSRVLAAGSAILLGSLLSMSMEIAQFYDPGRGPALADAISNTVGTAVGAFVALTFPAGAQWRLPGMDVAWRPFALLMLTCWMGNRLFPYIPRLDFRAHLYLATPNALAFYGQMVCWLAAAVLIESMVGDTRSFPVLAFCVGAVFLARIFLIAGGIASTDLFAAVLALTVWPALLRLEWRAALVTALFAAMVVLQALEPFHFLSAPRPFGWIPFNSFILGSRETGVPVFFQKTFVYGTLLWLPVRAGAPLAWATVLGTALVFGLRRMQMYLPGRSAEITDALMVLLLAGTMWLVRETGDVSLAARHVDSQ